MKKLDQDENDPVALWAEIWRLRAAVEGPDGYATWQEAATAERIRCMKARNRLNEILYGSGAVIDSLEEAIESVGRRIESYVMKRESTHGVDQIMHMIAGLEYWIDIDHTDAANIARERIRNVLLDSISPEKQLSEETRKTFEYISDPKNAHLFSKEAAIKAFSHVKIQISCHCFDDASKKYCKDKGNCVRIEAQGN